MSNCDDNGLAVVFGPSFFIDFLKQMQIFTQIFLPAVHLFKQTGSFYGKKSSETASGYRKCEEKWRENTNELLVMHQSHSK